MLGVATTASKNNSKTTVGKNDVRKSAIGPIIFLKKFAPRRFPNNVIFPKKKTFGTRFSKKAIFLRFLNNTTISCGIVQHHTTIYEKL